MTLLTKKSEILGYDKREEGDKITFILNENYWGRETVTLNGMVNDMEKNGLKEFAITGNEKCKKDLQYFIPSRINEADSNKFKGSILDHEYALGFSAGLGFLVTTGSYFEKILPETHPIPYILGSLIVMDSVAIATRKIRKKLSKKRTKKIDKEISFLKEIRQQLVKPGLRVSYNA